jgi:hypothetical protein
MEIDDGEGVNIIKNLFQIRIQHVENGFTDEGILKFRILWDIKFYF